MKVVLILALALSLSGCAVVCPLLEGSFAGSICTTPDETETETE